jgi:hypothetical protein
MSRTVGQPRESLGSARTRALGTVAARLPPTHVHYSAGGQAVKRPDGPVVARRERRQSFAEAARVARGEARSSTSGAGSQWPPRVRPDLRRAKGGRRWAGSLPGSLLPAAIRHRVRHVAQSASRQGRTTAARWIAGSAAWVIGPLASAGRPQVAGHATSPPTTRGRPSGNHLRSWVLTWVWRLGRISAASQIRPFRLEVRATSRSCGAWRGDRSPTVVEATWRNRFGAEGRMPGAIGIAQPAAGARTRSPCRSSMASARAGETGRRGGGCAPRSPARRAGSWRGGGRRPQFDDNHGNRGALSGALEPGTLTHPYR